MSIIKKIGVTVALFLTAAMPVAAQTISGPVYPYAFQATAGNKLGQIMIFWTDDGTAARYDLMYGFNPEVYQWGVQHMQFVANNTNSYTIGFLTPGATYYLALVARIGDNFVAISGPIAMQAASSTMHVVSTTSKSSAQLTTAGPVSSYNFQATTGQAKGTIDLSWTDDDTANQYDIGFGFKPGQYVWGADDLPEAANTVNRYTVRFLTPGAIYYLTLIPEKGGQAVTTTFPIGVKAR